MEVERVVVAAFDRASAQLWLWFESLVRRILAMVSSSNTMWAFTFLDSLASGASTSVLGRAGTAPFASARNEDSIKAFRDCVDKLLLGDAQENHAAAAPLQGWAFHIGRSMTDVARENFEDRETYYKWLLKEPDERFEAFLEYVEKEEEKLQKSFLVKEPTNETRNLRHDHTSQVAKTCSSKDCAKTIVC
ncbi:hypothetical protein SELMODRAFT_420285 [Selaginella moellendorffii]|uniref:Uncharacterized protein n=1 Tax=Selaginella moellendorffii TaxID=88036 RepID=D8SBI2_SELML|nr:hypothetical protein SELMODRAFT_420285 [Selaginella moellendorffii]